MIDTAARARNRRGVPALVLLIAAGAQIAAQPQRPAAIVFPTSGSPAAHAEFLIGVAALHNFEYEDANSAFIKAQQIDPGFAMAYWGEAMTYHQTLWLNEDVGTARRILSRLAPDAGARAAKAGTERERGFLAAAEALFGDGDVTARRAAHARVMAANYARFPDDPEVATFYALALLGTMARGLDGAMDAHEGHSAALAGSATQTRVTSILEKVLRSHPRHPGALHYLLHNNDDPAHARLALPAAGTYAQVAPASSHAQHMPAHIFLQLGMWREAARSDQAAYAASDAWVKARRLPLTVRSYHALSWLQYELLQLGRHREARDTLAQIEPVVKASGDLGLVSEQASMRARYVVDTSGWQLLARERNFGNVNELFAIGISAARTGNASAAELSRQALAERSRAEQEGDMRPVIAIMEREMAALIELGAGRRDRAVEILRAAAQAEQLLPAPLGLPKPIKPAPELLGEVLTEIGRPREAIAPFQQALRRNANRTLSVLGLARAAQASGDAATAKTQYGALLKNYAGADAGLPALNEARAAVNGNAPR
jgi:tetratricopeptide (TPR) repeat protein